MRRPIPRTSIVTVAVLSFILHQIISVPLFVCGMIQGESSAPENLLTYVTYVLCWPFVVVSRLHPGKDPLLIASWFFGSLFWAVVGCIIVALFRKKRLRDVAD
jgi:hypothetical protein